MNNKYEINKIKNLKLKTETLNLFYNIELDCNLNSLKGI